MSTDSVKPLAKQTFILTRPAAQSENLYSLLTALGGSCYVSPTLQIVPLPFQLPSSPPDKALFVSANAVYPVEPYWPLASFVDVFAIGPGTARALAAAFSIEATIPHAEQFNSEGLLALPHLQQVTGQRIFIFQGLNSRPLLAETLRRRGGEVHEIAVYSRVCPSGNLVSDIPCWQTDTSVWFISTSRESLENLWQMTGRQQQSWLREQRLVVISEKMAALAEQLGFSHPAVVANNASDAAIVAAVCANNK